MAILLNVYQDNRKNSNKLFYARPYYPNTLDTKALAKQITRMCTVTEPDVLAVLAELVAVMNYELSNSNRVKLDDFGYFSVGASTSGALQKEDWNVAENLKSFHINFQPTRSMTRNSKGKRTTATRSIGWGLQYKVVDLVEKAKEEPDPGE